MNVTRQCPTGDGTSLVSFPIGIEGVNPSISTYNSIINPLNLEFTWGSSSVLPEFSLESISFANVYHPSFPTTSLSYKENNYVLQSVQFTNPTHQAWLALTTTMATPLNNKEDVILTFMTENIPGESARKNPQFIILVSPIIRIDNAIRSSAFLNSLANQVAGPVGPDSLFPNTPGSQFAYYTTCSAGINTNIDFNNSLVVINVQGLLVWDQIMLNILTLYNKTSTDAGFPVFIPPVYGLFSEIPTILKDMSSFMRVVAVSIQYTTSAPSSTSSTSAPSAPSAPSSTSAPSPLSSTSAQTSTYPVKDYSTDAYKCVPLNPATDVSGGAIKIDSTNGQILSNTLTDRKTAIDAYNTTGVSSIPYNVFEKYTRIFLIVMISIIGFWLLIYSVLSLAVGPEATGGGASKIKMAFTNLLKVPFYIVIAFFCTFAGLMLGIYFKPN